MFKIGERYQVNGNKGTIHLVSKDKTRALIKYDNPSLGHSGNNYSEYYYDDNGNKVDFKNLSSFGYFFVGIGFPDILTKVNESIDYEIY